VLHFGASACIVGGRASRSCVLAVARARYCIEDSVNIFEPPQVEKNKIHQELEAAERAAADLTARYQNAREEADKAKVRHQLCRNATHLLPTQQTKGCLTSKQRWAWLALEEFCKQ